MVVKLVALYKKPADIAAFEKHYKEIHAPLAKKMPGLQKLEVAHMTGSPGGEPKFYMMAELYFDTGDALKTALSSPEGKAAAKDVMGFAGDLIHMMFASVDE
ncbi:MAG: EthD family reductase [Planctomycetota bacterium]